MYPYRGKKVVYYDDPRFTSRINLPAPAKREDFKQSTSVPLSDWEEKCSESNCAIDSSTDRIDPEYASSDIEAMELARPKDVEGERTL
jgi:hypothetical protein